MEEDLAPLGRKGEKFLMPRSRILAVLLVLVVAGADQAWSYASPPFVGAGRHHKFDRVHREEPLLPCLLPP